MRCNAGVDPQVLTDQHLIAEYRELMIPVGQLRKLNWVSKTEAPAELKLGKGHIVFWRDKQLYLKRRHEALVHEMKFRGFNPKYSFWDLEDIPKEFLNDWTPDQKATNLLRQRIWEKILLKPEWYRRYKKPLGSIKEYRETLFFSHIAF